MKTRLFIQATLFFTIAGGLHAQSTGASFGTVITLGGTPSDVVLDEPRQLLYLVNSAANRVDLFSTAVNGLIGNIPVGATPLAAAISLDGGFLYVTNSGSLSVSVIDLKARVVRQSFMVPAAPQGVEVGADGRALISTLGTGTAAAPANTLLIYDPGSMAVTPVLTPPPPTTPSPLPATTLARPDTTFTSKLIRTPNGQYIVGLTNPALTPTQTYLFVYEVASGTILRSRTVTGQSTVLAMSPDGSRFMAGFTLYDTATLSILGQMNNANAAFPFTSVFSTRQNVGGSVFSPDGQNIYGAFNVTAFSNPPAPANSSTLMLSDPSNLAIRMGIRMPESIVAKMVITSDGANAWGLSQSGLVYLPFLTLTNYPILMPSATQVFLTQNPCNAGLAQATVQINNIGSGKLTYAVNTVSNALTSAVASGVAPSSVTFTMEPGRLGITRKAGTNLATGGGVTLSGQPLDIQLASNEAINVLPLIRVYMNYRNPDQRGVIYPLPVTPNNSATAALITTAVIAGDQGLEDIALDQPRNRVYVTNAGYNRVEVFDTINQVFLTPIAVGQLPHQMAMSTDGNTLYVASTGGELIDIVDLNIMRDVGHISFPPIPRQSGGATAALLYPQAMAESVSGLEFVMSNGSQWKVVGGTAIPRALDTITKTGATNLFTPPVYMLGSPDNARILTLSNNGAAYLYDGTSDAYIAGPATLFTAPFQTFFGPLSAGPAQSWYALGGLYTNSSLTLLGGASNPAGQTGVQRNAVATAPYDANNFVRLSTPVLTSITAAPTSDARPTLELVNTNTGAVRPLAVAPENPRFTLLANARYNIPPRSMVIDNNNVAYIITLSGLSMVPLTPNGAPAPAISTSARAIVSAADGTTNLKIGGVINITGTNLASPAIASTLPPPSVLGGACVTFNDVALPLLQTAAGQIQAQIPTAVSPGSNVVQVRSLGTGQQSAPLVVTVQTPSGGTGTPSGGSTSVDQGRNNIRVTPQ